MLVGLRALLRSKTLPVWTLPLPALDVFNLTLAPCVERCSRGLQCPGAWFAHVDDDEGCSDFASLRAPPHYGGVLAVPGHANHRPGEHRQSVVLMLNAEAVPVCLGLGLSPFSSPVSSLLAGCPCAQR